MKNTTFTPGLLERGGGPGKLPESTRALLVKNGTLNRDGSYNVETARAQLGDSFGSAAEDGPRDFDVGALLEQLQ